MSSQLTDHMKGIYFDNETSFFSIHQVLNRDVTSTILQDLFRGNRRDIKILDAFCGSGMRGLKNAMAIPNSTVLGIDVDRFSLSTAQRNSTALGLSRRVSWIERDIHVALRNFQCDKTLFDVIDIDPFGSSLPYLEDCIGCLRIGGILCLNFTDSSILFGGRRDELISYYRLEDNTAIASVCSHEYAIRLLVASIRAIVIKLGRSLEPLACWGYGNGCRLIIKISEASNPVPGMLPRFASKSLMPVASCKENNFVSAIDTDGKNLCICLEVSCRGQRYLCMYPKHSSTENSMSW